MKKGVSLVSLGITLIILVLIISVVVVNSQSSVDSLNRAKFVTEFSLIESAVEKYYSMNESYPILEEITLTYSASEQGQFEGESINNNTLILNKVDVTTLGYDNLMFGTGKVENDYYAVSTLTGKVYYVKGFEIDNTTYFRVTDDLVEKYE